MASYQLREHEFVIDRYADTRPFASFLPGISGVWGIPLWAFYVNRGQAIAGFGVQDKDNPIMEFLPANRAYRAVPLHGFRTFVRTGTTRPAVYEPFAPGAGPARMRVRMHDLALETRQPAGPLETSVHYFTIPGEPFAALARTVTFTNRGRRPLAFEVVDGLPVMVPYGMRDYFLKNMSRTIEAWVQVTNVEAGAPFFQLKTEVHDRPEVVPLRAGNFALGLLEQDGRAAPLSPIVDPAAVFGLREDFVSPIRLLDRSFRVPRRQVVQELTPCALWHGQVRLRAGASCRLVELYGHVEHLEALTGQIAPQVSPAWFDQKTEDNRALIEAVTDPIATTSRSRTFDLYCRQTLLDNILRGGVPTLLGDGPGRKTVYVFSRKHGDLERDYNFFVVPATHFSQGNANYRDVNQNRRSDVWFYPAIGEQNVLTFFNLLQADGFNPLVFKGTRYVAPDYPGATPAVQELLAKPFTPGELLRTIERRRLKLPQPPETFLHDVMSRAREVEDADHGEGFWTDHWAYNLDLLESFLAIYPERLRELLIERPIFTFYDNAHVVAPRSQKYRDAHHGLRQYHAVHKDPDKAALIQARADEPHAMRIHHGKGPVYRTLLLTKMVCVVVNKLASLDPSGAGIEMEADKPNWFDALNGLPGLVGSSLCETFELKRWVRFLLWAIDATELDDRWAFHVPEELAQFLRDVDAALEEAPPGAWHRATTAKEAYRAKIRLGFSGPEAPVAVHELRRMLTRALAVLDRALAQGYDKTRGLYASYFFHQPAEGARRAEHAIPDAWTRHTLPPFLEGAVHALRLETDPARARALHRAVKRSPLYDRKLGMYRVCAPLERESVEIGRCKAFNPGWLENQSIWLHMEYKYLLELLRAGLHEEFYAELPKTLIPFQPPARYGRSILENSSFLVSSAHADPRLHGAGFVARLSGATAEFLQMWLWMMVGRSPFALTKKGELVLRLAPVLSNEFFGADGTLTFTLLGHTTVRYLNPSRRATFGPQAAKPVAMQLHPKAGAGLEIRGETIPHPYAAMVRDGAIGAIDVTLG